MVSSTLYIGSLVFSGISLILIVVVLALQLGLNQWGSKDVDNGLPARPRKRKPDIPILWTTSCLLYLTASNTVNTAIWHGPLWMSIWDGRIWCDIDVRLQLAASTGLLTGATAIARNLCLIISAKSEPYYFQSNKKLLVDALLCVTLPILQVSFVYFIQMHRYGITEIFGCTLLLYLSVPAIIVYSMWTPIFSLAAAAYACTCVYQTYKRKKYFQNILMFTDSGLSTFQFIRILMFNFTIVFAMLPLALATFITRTAGDTIGGSYTLSQLHFDYNTVIYIPYMSSIVIQRWLYGTFSYVAFFTFGLGTEAQMAYMKILDILHIGWLFRAFGRKVKRGFIYLIPKSWIEKFEKKQTAKKSVIPSQYRNMGGDDSKNGSTVSQIMRRTSNQSNESADPYVDGQFSSRFEYNNLEPQHKIYDLSRIKDLVGASDHSSPDNASSRQNDSNENQNKTRAQLSMVYREPTNADISEFYFKGIESACVAPLDSPDSDNTAFPIDDVTLHSNKANHYYTFSEESDDGETFYGIKNSPSHYGLPVSDQGNLKIGSRHSDPSVIINSYLNSPTSGSTPESVNRQTAEAPPISPNSTSSTSTKVFYYDNEKEYDPGNKSQTPSICSAQGSKEDGDEKANSDSSYQNSP